MMIADEVLELTRERIAAIVAGQPQSATSAPDERRRGPRWPVGGLVEVWGRGLAAGHAAYGTCREVSEHGIGVECSRTFEAGTRVEMALYLPESAFRGQGTVRYCTPCERGYSIGIEFDFAG